MQEGTASFESPGRSADDKISIIEYPSMNEKMLSESEIPNQKKQRLESGIESVVNLNASQ